MADIEVVTPGTAGRPQPGPAASASPARPPGDDGAVMSLVDHLSELRRRLVISVLAVAVGTVIGFILAPRIIFLLVQPLPTQRVVFTGLGGAFFLQVKVAAFVGIALAIPVVLWQLWKFVSPGLTARERRMARPWVPLTVVFFAAGVAVGYVVLPYTAAFLLGFQTPELQALITADEYFGFVTLMFAAFGIVMQFPVALVLLSKMGIVDVNRLRRSRRYVFLGIFLFAVVITPGGDPVSPTVLGSVMYVLFEFTILLLRRGASETDEA
jgi:sec-independent protein translocase protein TatC